MVEIEQPRVTEINVRMDCNGCVHKVKKALHGITGIYDICIDVAQQKITITGWADPDKIVKAIKKARKTATVCETEQQSGQPEQQTTEQVPEGGVPPEGGAPPPETTNPPPEPPQTEGMPQPPQTEQQNQSHETTNATPSQPNQPYQGTYHNPDHGYQQAYPGGPGGPGPSEPPQPVYTTHGYNTYNQPPPQQAYMTHSYNTYNPSPYVTEYAYPQPPPVYSYYSRPERYSRDSYSGYNGNGNITSMFSEENPNACRIA